MCESNSMVLGLTNGVMGGRAPAAVAGGGAHAQIQGLIGDLRESGKALTLGNLLLMGQERGLQARQIANLSGQDVSGFIFKQDDLNLLRQAESDSSLRINLNGANISDAVFHPASTFNGVIIDECTVENSEMRSVKFVGLSGEQANLNFARVDVSGLQVMGARAESPARNVNITLTDATAQDMNIAGSGLLKLHALGSDVSGLDASNSRGLQLKVEGGSLQDATFDSVTFAPGSEAINTDLRGASFQGTDIGELNMSGSRIEAANLIGARDKGVEITQDNVSQVMAQKGLVAPMLDEYAVPNIPLSATDALIQQLTAARGGQKNVKDARIAKQAKQQRSLDIFRKPEGPSNGVSV